MCKNDLKQFLLMNIELFFNMHHILIIIYNIINYEVVKQIDFHLDHYLILSNVILNCLMNGFENQIKY